MTAEHRLQANLNDLSDPDLMDYLTYYYHHIKDIEIKRQNDGTIQRLKAELREHEAGYNADIRDCQRKIKAARALCELRGLSFSLDKKG